MSYYLKTEYQCNEDDFVQNGDFLNELTVTITLCEYRNLIEERTRHEMTIDKLEKELKDARESFKNLMSIFMVKSPNVINKICDAFSELFPQSKNETQEGESNEQIPKQENND